MTEGLDITTIKKKNRSWIWFFLLLVVLSIIAVATIVIYNLQQQLTIADLQAAQALWQEQGPRNYEIEYVRKVIKDRDEVLTRCHVRVRNGQVVYADVDGVAQTADKFKYYGVPAIFDEIQRFLEMDAEPGQPWTYTRAIFDAQYGYPKWYVRRVMGQRYRIEIYVAKDAYGDEKFRILQPHKAESGK